MRVIKVALIAPVVVLLEIVAAGLFFASEGFGFVADWLYDKTF